MTKNQDIAFDKLFKEACKKFFNHSLDGPLSETHSKRFCIEVEEKTGLVIGFKSVKNYSIYISGGKTSKKENPSPATLDTLARYVLNAPVTTEQDRKKNESHYPYWHQYQKALSQPFRAKWLWSVPIAGLMIVISWFVWTNRPSTKTNFQDGFENTDWPALEAKSWQLINKDKQFWDQRSNEKGFLRLFTLEGDNWPDSSNSTPLEIKNLLVRPIEEDCFVAEVHLKDFVPTERWQQAGIIVLEDSTFTGRVLRLSIAYNDFFGGFKKPKEIILQGIISQGDNNPEEIIHHQLFEFDSSLQKIVEDNLQFCGLRFEKNNEQFRFLLAYGATNNVAFKEVGEHDFTISPQYIGIFALKGNMPNSSVIPAKFSSFKLEYQACVD